MTTFSEEWISSLIEKSSKINNGKVSQKNGPYNVILILDDLANEKAFTIVKQFANYAEEGDIHFYLCRSAIT